MAKWHAGGRGRPPKGSNYHKKGKSCPYPKRSRGRPKGSASSISGKRVWGYVVKK